MLVSRRTEGGPLFNFDYRAGSELEEEVAVGTFITDADLFADEHFSVVHHDIEDLFEHNFQRFAPPSPPIGAPLAPFPLPYEVGHEV